MRTSLTDDQWVRNCVKIADSIDVPDKIAYLASLVILGSSVYDSQMIMDIISEETMQHTDIVEYLAPQARELGKAEGIAQGIEQGKKEQAVVAILTVLDVKPTEKLRPFLSAIDDLQRLDHLHRVAIQTSDLDAFTRALLNLEN